MGVVCAVVLRLLVDDALPQRRVRLKRGLRVWLPYWSRWAIEHWSRLAVAALYLLVALTTLWPQDRLYEEDWPGYRGFGRADPPGGTFVDISAGEDRTCGVRTGGELVCWGDEFGKPPGGRFVKVDVWDQRGAGNACAVGADGALRCWGRFRSGSDLELLGHDNDFGQADPPGGVFVDVSVGERYACALRADGSAVCWGDNLGKSYSTAPQYEWWPKGALAVPEGPFAQVHASIPPCGLRISGEVVCWSDQGRRLMDAWAPDDAPDNVLNNKWTQLVAGWGSRLISDNAVLCGIRADATVGCSPYGAYRERDSEPGRSAFVLVTPDLYPWVGSGEFRVMDWTSDAMCAVRADRSIDCTESHSEHILSDVRDDWRYALTDPPQGEFAQVAAGRVHACAIRTDGTVACWGNNSDRPRNPATSCRRRACPDGDGAVRLAGQRAAARTTAGRVTVRLSELWSAT